MKQIRKISELKYLENYRLLFVNLEEVQDLKSEMAEYGYDDQKIAEGKALYDKTQSLYNKNKQETAEEREAYAHFAQSYEEMKKSYAKHRKIAKVALMKKTRTLEQPCYRWKFISGLPQKYGRNQNAIYPN